MLYHVTIGARTLRVELTGERVIVDDVELGAAELATVPGTPVRHLLLGGASTDVTAERDDTGWTLQVDGWPVRAEAVDERTRALRALTSQAGGSHAPRPVRAPMPGLIVRTEVGVGDHVRRGQGVVVMEAMKMENELKAEADGVVARIMVEAGTAVEKGTVLVEFEATTA